MALFGTPSAFLGIDIGASSLKLVELVVRRRRIEVATYAQANMSNLLITPQEGKETSTITKVADTIAAMMDRAGVSADTAIAALPSSIVFSTVLTLPALPEAEIDKAVHFAARDVVPADIDEMVLGWSQLGASPHMDTDAAPERQAPALPGAAPAAIAAPPVATTSPLPIFVTAAPKDIVERYLKVMNLLRLRLQALEVETFPLVRSLFENPLVAEGLIVDIGDVTTTFHIIDAGTPRLSHTIEFGGANITAAIAEALHLSQEAAEVEKVSHGASDSASQPLREAVTKACAPLLDQARQLLALYASQGSRAPRKSLLIGGGANLKGLVAMWEAALGHKAVIGNPWRGLAYPQALEEKLQRLGPTYAVAVGLAERGARSVQ